MALVVGGTTVTGTQTLDATKLTGNLPAINGASLTSLNASNIGSGTIASDRVPTLDGSKISGGTLGATNGSNITSLPSPSSIIYASQAVGCFAMIRFNDHGNFSWGCNVGTNVRASDADNTGGSTAGGTWRGFGQSSTSFRASVGHRIS